MGEQREGRSLKRGWSSDTAVETDEDGFVNIEKNETTAPNGQADNDRSQETVKVEGKNHASSQATSPNTTEAPRERSQRISRGPQPPPQEPIPQEQKDFLERVEAVDPDCPGMYQAFLNLMREFHVRSINTVGLMVDVAMLFYRHPQLVEGFNLWLPQGCSMVVHRDGASHCIRCIAPTDRMIVRSPDCVCEDVTPPEETKNEAEAGSLDRPTKSDDNRRKSSRSDAETPAPRQISTCGPWMRRVDPRSCRIAEENGRGREWRRRRW